MDPLQKIIGIYDVFDYPPGHNDVISVRSCIIFQGSTKDFLMSAFLQPFYGNLVHLDRMSGPAFFPKNIRDLSDPRSDVQYPSRDLSSPMGNRLGKFASSN